MQAEACNFIKKETQAQVFSCEFCKISKYTFSTEHVWAAACYLFISFIQKVIFLTRHGFAPRKIIGKTIMFGCFPLEEFISRRHSKWPYVNMIQKQLFKIMFTLYRKDYRNVTKFVLDRSSVQIWNALFSTSFFLKVGTSSNER